MEKGREERERERDQEKESKAKKHFGYMEETSLSLSLSLFKLLQSSLGLQYSRPRKRRTLSAFVSTGLSKR